MHVPLMDDMMHLCMVLKTEPEGHDPKIILNPNLRDLGAKDLHKPQFQIFETCIAHEKKKDNHWEHILCRKKGTHYI